MLQKGNGSFLMSPVLSPGYFSKLSTAIILTAGLLCVLVFFLSVLAKGTFFMWACDATLPFRWLSWNIMIYCNCDCMAQCRLFSSLTIVKRVFFVQNFEFVSSLYLELLLNGPSHWQKKFQCKLTVCLFFGGMFLECKKKNWPSSAYSSERTAWIIKAHPFPPNLCVCRKPLRINWVFIDISNILCEKFWSWREAVMLQRIRFLPPSLCV